VSPLTTYELATSNYLAGGGSGYRVLQRNTTQLDTKIQQRDALTDYLRQGKPCGWSAKETTSEGLHACRTDADCAGSTDPEVCACTGAATENAQTGVCSTTGSCDPSVGRCVLAACQNDVAAFHRKRCETAPDATTKAACKTALGACEIAGEECKFLACVNGTIGSASDDRIIMEGQ
jgi:5'-nucleotidase